MDHTPAYELTELERDQLIRSIVSSEAFEGVELTYELVSQLLDRVVRRIGGRYDLANPVGPRLNGDSDWPFRASLAPRSSTTREISR